MKLSDASVFSAWPSFSPEEVDAVAAVLRSGKVNYWTGEIGREFERDYAAHTGRRHAIAVANGSVALELGLMTFGIGHGDEVITSSRTYIASAGCAVMRGAIPVTADVDSESQCITADTIRAVLTPKTRAIVAVHLAGWPCPMDEIMAVAAERNLVVIEDCAQAHGARYKGKPVGSFGHAGAFSFCQDKIISTGGEGGMLVLDDEEAWARAWSYKDIGRSYDATYGRTHQPGFRWVSESFGTNWRMTEMQAAIGRIQLKRLPEWKARRQANAAILMEGFSRIPGLRTTTPPDWVDHAYYRFYVFLETERLKPEWNQIRVMETIEAGGVPCSVGSCSEIYLEKAFRDRGWCPTRRLPMAQRLGESSLAFLVHPTLGQEALNHTLLVVRDVMKRAVK
jgi:dTDP-4-amino-4,6-dideoxygalactose transaminase